MSPIRLPLILLLVATAFAAAPAKKSMSTFERLSKNDRSGTAWSVRVPDGPLIFTQQVAAASPGGEAKAEAAGALQNLASVLAGVGSDLTRVVRLNAYVADDAAVAAVDSAVAAQFAATPVAFTLTRTPLTTGGARVLFEAVATTSRAPAVPEIFERAAVLPAGGKIFISGQVERGTDLASGCAATMAGLYRSLEHFGLTKGDVVQVKAFFRPVADPSIATQAITASFGAGKVPPIILQEWTSDTWVEIELIASARSLPAKAGESITYTWLPWLTPSPRYCNIAHVMPGTPLIFIGEVNGGDTNDPRTQMKTIFERLGSILFEAGSSYRTMAKATYYLKDPTARALLGDIRGVYFDPTRAPAASALGVTSFGRPGRAAMIDMIAVPVQ
jgi:enamine deaminase RidA (YjgF/YER057c/UK114 family)